MDKNNDDEEEDEDDEEEQVDPDIQFGYPVAPDGSWASCLRVVDTVKDGETLNLHEFPANEAAFALCLLRFRQRPNDPPFLVVGTAKNLQTQPLKCTEGKIYVYALLEDG